METEVQLSDLKQMRKTGQDQVEPRVYVPARLISIYITRLLIGTRVTPNGVTIFWFFCLLGASAAFAVGEYVYLVAGAVIVFLSYVFDCVDGELARITRRTSKIGIQLEQMVHWTTNGFLLLGITTGLYVTTHNPLIWPLGALTIIGDFTFHFLYIQLYQTADLERDYGFLHTYTRWLYTAMPINTNLMIVGALTNQLRVFLIIWAVLSNVSWLIVFGLYYRTEVKEIQRNDLDHNT